MNDLKFVDWLQGENTQREQEISTRLQAVFVDFWTHCGIDDKSAKTQKRYIDGLNSLGGYLVEKSVYGNDKDLKMAADELLAEYLNDEDGPLIFMDNESWQNEFDGVCRKLYKFLCEKKYIKG